MPSGLFYQYIQTSQLLFTCQINLKVVLHQTHSLALAARYKDAFDFEVIPYVTPRDATLFGLTKQILTAYATSNIRNFLIIKGDPYKVTDELKGIEYPNTAEAIKEIDSHLRRSNLELNIRLGAAFNQNALDKYHEEVHTQQKQLAGADFFMSQPVFDETQAINAARFYRNSIGNTQMPLIMGIWPLASVEVIEKIHAGKIEGVVMSEDIYDQAVALSDPVTLKAWSEQKTTEIVKCIQEERLAQGIYVVAPYRKPSRLISFINSIAACNSNAV